jgi:hypothetical protein
MNIFDIIKNLYTNKSSKWINDMDDSDISPIVIQRFLCLDLKTQKKARILNRFVHSISPKMYLSAAWTLLFFNGEKLNKSPFIKYPNTKKPQEKYQKLYDKIKRQYHMADKDLFTVKKFIDADIEKNKVEWFAFYGMNNEFWHSHGLEFSLIKEYNKREIKKGLDAWR